MKDHSSFKASFLEPFSGHFLVSEAHTKDGPKNPAKVVLKRGSAAPGVDKRIVV